MIHAYDHGVVDGNWYSEFSVPASLLTKKALMVFTIPGRKPGVIALKSIAWADYQITLASVNDLRQEGISPGGEQVEQLRKLRLLDPSLKPRAIASRPTTVASEPHSVIILKIAQKYVFKNGDYPWSCTDPNTRGPVYVNQGDDFWLNVEPRSQDTSYSITVRPERYARSTPYDPTHDSGMCIVNADILNSMVGAGH